MRGISKAFWDKKASLPLVAIALGETQQQVSSGQVGEDKCKALRPVLKECEAKLAKLETIFQKTLPENGISKVRRGWMALSSLRQDKKSGRDSTGAWEVSTSLDILPCCFGTDGAGYRSADGGCL